MNSLILVTLLLYHCFDHVTGKRPGETGVSSYVEVLRDDFHERSRQMVDALWAANEEMPDSCRTDLCPDETRLDDSRKFSSTFPKTRGGERRFMLCPWSLDKSHYVYRDCNIEVDGSFQKKSDFKRVYWSDHVINKDCPDSPISQIIEKLYVSEVHLSQDINKMNIAMEQMIQMIDRFPNTEISEKFLLPYVFLLKHMVITYSEARVQMSWSRSKQMLKLLNEVFSYDTEWGVLFEEEYEHGESLQSVAIALLQYTLQHVFSIFEKEGQTTLEFKHLMFVPVSPVDLADGQTHVTDGFKYYRYRLRDKYITNITDADKIYMEKNIPKVALEAKGLGGPYGVFILKSSYIWFGQINTSLAVTEEAVLSYNIADYFDTIFFRYGVTSDDFSQYNYDGSPSDYGPDSDYGYFNDGHFFPGYESQWNHTDAHENDSDYGTYAYDSYGYDSEYGYINEDGSFHHYDMHDLFNFTDGHVGSNDTEDSVFANDSGLPWDDAYDEPWFFDEDKLMSNDTINTNNDTLSSTIRNKNQTFVSNQSAHESTWNKSDELVSKMISITQSPVSRRKKRAVLDTTLHRPKYKVDRTQLKKDHFKIPQDNRNKLWDYLNPQVKHAWSGRHIKLKKRTVKYKRHDVSLNKLKVDDGLPAELTGLRRRDWPRKSRLSELGRNKLIKRIRGNVELDKLTVKRHPTKKHVLQRNRRFVDIVLYYGAIGPLVFVSGNSGLEKNDLRVNISIYMGFETEYDVHIMGNSEIGYVKFVDITADVTENDCTFTMDQNTSVFNAVCVGLGLFTGTADRLFISDSLFPDDPVILKINLPSFLGFVYSVQVTTVENILGGISLVCLLLTLVSYFNLKKEQTNISTRILVNLCASLIILSCVLNIVHNVELTMTTCRLVNILRYYLIFVTLLWNGAEAVNMYLKLIKVYNSEVRRFVLKAGIIAWGLPVLFVVVNLLVSKKAFDGEYVVLQEMFDAGECTYRCQLRSSTLYFGYLIPMCVIIANNLAIFAMVTCVMVKQGRKEKDQFRTRVTQLTGAVSVLILFGIPWIFSVFGALNAQVSSQMTTVQGFMQLVFAITVNIQGLFIFMFYCVKKKAVRENWGKILPLLGK